MPSLDAATNKVFRKINRPHPRLAVDRMVDGLIRFREEFSGRLWLEIFIVPGLNDNKAELKALKLGIEKISPDLIQLNTLDRPGPVPDIRPASCEELGRIIQSWQLDNVAIIAKATDEKSR